MIGDPIRVWCLHCAQDCTSGCPNADECSGVDPMTPDQMATEIIRLRALVSAPPIMTPDQEYKCLQYDPFAGDFGMPGDRTLSDKIVTTTRGGACHICAQPITPGSRIRSCADLSDGEVNRYRWCSACCIAMAVSWSDNGLAIQARYAIGETKSFKDRYSPRRRAEIWTIADSMFRHQWTGADEDAGTEAHATGPYGESYARRKAATADREWNGHRREADARRIMTKQFIEDLWKAWRACTLPSDNPIRQ